MKTTDDYGIFLVGSDNGEFSIGFECSELVQRRLVGLDEIGGFCKMTGKLKLSHLAECGDLNCSAQRLLSEASVTSRYVWVHARELLPKLVGVTVEVATELFNQSPLGAFDRPSMDEMRADIDKAYEAELRISATSQADELLQQGLTELLGSVLGGQPGRTGGADN